jgi:hypothetical protein
MVDSLRRSRLGDRRFTDTGLSIADAHALVPQVLEFAAQPRTKEELEEMLTERIGSLPKPASGGHCAPSPR